MAAFHEDCNGSRAMALFPQVLSRGHRFLEDNKLDSVAEDFLRKSETETNLTGEEAVERFVNIHCVIATEDILRYIRYSPEWLDYCTRHKMLDGDVPPMPSLDSITEEYATAFEVLCADYVLKQYLVPTKGSLNPDDDTSDAGYMMHLKESVKQKFESLLGGIYWMDTDGDGTPEPASVDNVVLRQRLPGGAGYQVL